jgi:hypothetical protein
MLLTLKLLATYIITCCLIALACAQLPTTHAGPGSPGGGGGGGTCTGTAFHVTSPNDLTNAAWINSAGIVTVNFGFTAPNSTLTASDIKTTSAAGGSGSAYSQQVLGSGTTGWAGVTYAFSAYFKSVVAPTWIFYGVSDGIANAWQKAFNLSGAGVVGSASHDAGNGATTCTSIRTDLNGFYFVTIGGQFTGTPAGTPILYITLVDADATAAPTVNQEIQTWQVSP